jgi:ribosomal protein S18 acetylase RimI-like enzyme
MRALESSRTPTLTAILRVQTTNMPAISLYTSLGFLSEAIEPTYYKGALTGSIAAHKMMKRITKD